MRFGSAASGIEAASVAWEPLGFESAWFSEIDPFCCSLLNQRHGKTPNIGDMNAITTHALRKCGKLDAVIAGTPCQAFSVAGKRDGITDPRGQLALRLLDLVEYTRPRWFVWENVPGVLSSWTGPDTPGDLCLQPGQRREYEVTEASDFGCLLGALGQLGYGWAYRVYDAQFAGVPQRRRRVFLVGYLGDWTRAANVLFEPHCVSGNTPKGRKTGTDITGTLSSRTSGGGGRGTDFECDGGLIAHTLRGEGYDASEDGTGRGTPLVPVTVSSLTTKPYADNESQEDKLIVMAHGQAGAEVIAGQCRTLTCNHEAPILFSCKDYGADAGPISPTLRAMGHSGSHANAGGQVAIAFDARQSDVIQYGTKTGPLDTNGFSFGIHQPRRAVRRLTPRECERLQGFPDDYTLITYRKKPAADGPRYKSISNSIAIPDLRWIGQRILEHDK